MKTDRKTPPKRLHNWAPVPFRNDTQRCVACGLERALVTRSRRRMGYKLGKVWMAWQVVGTYPSGKPRREQRERMGPCPGPQPGRG